jgi:hypothetical protein
MDAELDPQISRWLWLVKWVLAIPHFVVLTFLWVAYVALTIVAFFAIAFTGRYPRSIFEFNVGVLRWSWRVAYYSFGANGTDRYPPFTLEEVPDYPTHLEVEYPDRLSQGLVLVKWWLLAIPHYLVVALFAGGGGWIAWNVGNEDWTIGGNLIGLLVLVAVVVLAFTGSYPRGLFDLILGMNRWVLRVAAYAGLMTDRYPPFRLDMGGAEPGGTLTIPATPAGSPAGSPTVPARPDRGRARSGWTGGRVTALVIGSLLGLTSLGFLGGGGALLWIDRTQRDAQGFIGTGSHRFETEAFALTTQVDVDREAVTDWLSVDGPGVFSGPWSSEVVRVRIGAADSGDRIFVGVARTEDVRRYLEGVSVARITDLPDDAYRVRAGGAPAAAPGDRPFWASARTGTGTQAIRWSIQEGSWTFVVMNADGTRGVHVDADVAARFSPLPWIAGGIMIAGGILLIAATFLIAVPISRASRTGGGR